MKTPIWEVSPGALVALINTGQFVYAHLYTITLAGGNGTIRFTDADLSITDTTYTWDGRGLRVDAGDSKTLAHWKRGLDVDNWTLVVLPRTTDEITGDAFPDTINDVPWVEAAMQGALDGADIQVDRAYFAAWPQPYKLLNEPVGILTIFAGQPAEVDVSDTLVSIMLNDYRELLSIKMPRNIFQAGCRYTLYGSGCTLNQASFVQTATAIGGTTRKLIASAGLVPTGSGTFQLGKLKMTSGLNAGFVRTISSWGAINPGLFALLNPFPFDVVAGDTFEVYPGCDKQLATCTLFGNSVNFGGQPFIPTAETAI